jgi:hypothetical protein
MSGPYNPFEPMQASIRKHLGEFADLWMEQKIALLRKLAQRIAAATDTEELIKLRKELNDALISEEDITNLDEKLGKLLAMMKKHLQTAVEIKKISDEYRRDLNRNKD